MPINIVTGDITLRTDDATEQAYRLGDALEKRRRLMADWAAFV